LYRYKTVQRLAVSLFSGNDEPSMTHSADSIYLFIYSVLIFFYFMLLDHRTNNRCLLTTIASGCIPETPPPPPPPPRGLIHVREKLLTRTSCDANAEGE
jgi:hypothetical protein